MNVQRICFLGTRTPNFDATSALFRDVLGLRNVHTEVGWSIFQLPSGRSDFVEVFGPEHENARERLRHPTGQPPGRNLTSRTVPTGATSLAWASVREWPLSVDGEGSWLSGVAGTRSCCDVILS